MLINRRSSNFKTTCNAFNIKTCKISSAGLINAHMDILYTIKIFTPHYQHACHSTSQSECARAHGRSQTESRCGCASSRCYR